MLDLGRGTRLVNILLAKSGLINFTIYFSDRGYVYVNVAKIKIESRI
jgi:hypothetical protein